MVQGDPRNPARNGELGPSTNLNFGKPVVSSFYDRNWSHAFGKRPAQRECSAGIQLLPRVCMNAMFYRRVYINFTTNDNRLIGNADYDRFLPGTGNSLLMTWR